MRVTSVRRSRPVWREAMEAGAGAGECEVVVTGERE